MARAPHRSLWWTVHHWAGLKLGLLISFVLITGTIATVADEIDWLVRPAMREMPQPGNMASWGAWHTAAAAVPGFTVEEVLAPIEPGFAVRAKGLDADGKARLVHIDPWTARVKGVSSTVTVQDVVRDLHRTLMLPNAIGIVLVTSLSVPLLLTLVTAFKVYKRWWRGFFRWPRPMRHPREARRYVGDLHRLAGLCGACGSSRCWGSPGCGISPNGSAPRHQTRRVLPSPHRRARLPPRRSKR